ncbi:hypothetical protein CEXT_324421 [Caerostris extrusa]|uniref:Uncharacterized protein n=1 Tax=Caerostris extrusa TaxID=172846 RepID=A0AAV4UT51_CAEEX|nr:hypothetical protein CEXT_324421 [Caerostris extrusa]
MASDREFRRGTRLTSIDIVVRSHKKELDSPVGPRDSYAVNGMVDGEMGSKRGWAWFAEHLSSVCIGFFLEELVPGKQALKARRFARLPRKSRGQVTSGTPLQFYGVSETVKLLSVLLVYKTRCATASSWEWGLNLLGTGRMKRKDGY